MRGPVRLAAVMLSLLLPMAATSAAADRKAPPSAACAGLSPGPSRTVVRVIDGETVGLDDGSELRLIGALAPRALDVGTEPESWVVENRTREGLGKLLQGKSIELAFGGERLDRYGRLQAQAFLIEGEGRRWVQGYLLAQGLARAYTLAGNRACSAELVAAERSAREAHRGLWAEAAYQIRQANRPSALRPYLSTFQIVEGRIVRVAFVRGVIYLNFSHRWREGFSASLRSSDRTLLGPFAADPKGLDGRRVRVRGWIEGRRRLAIDLSVAGYIEILDGGAPSDRR